MNHYQLNHEQLLTLGEVVNLTSIEVFIFKKSDLKFVYLNQGALNKIQYSMDEICQMTPLDIKHDLEPEAFRRILQQAEDNGKTGLLFETRHYPKNAPCYPVEVKIQLLSWENQPAYVVFSMDISSRKKLENELRESEQKFKQIAQSIEAGIFIYTDYYEYANPAFEKITDYRESELKTMHPWEGLDIDLQKQLKPIIKRRLSGESFPKNYQKIQFTTKNGVKKTLRVNTQTILFQGRFAGLGTVIDITDLHETKEKLQLFSHVVEQTEDFIRITDPDGIITYANPAFYRFTGYHENELIGENNRLFKSGKMPAEFYQKLWQTITSGKSFKGTFINCKKDGEIFYEQQTITPLTNSKGTITYFVSTGKDITDRVQLEQRNELLAKTDKLTGASNRHRGDEFLANATDYAHINDSPLSVLLFDIDFFKNINDEYGHQAGDKVLVHISDLMNRELRQTDLFVRWGGEEFLVIATHTDIDKATLLAERIRQKIDGDHYKNFSHLTVSCGVTQLKKNENTEHLIQRVDKALYQAKELGRNTVVTMA
ncbi:sensor domain-containing diguanylate cyclase [Thiomicrorhabdus sediminis]|uniref:PAS domain S-box protein n=1 Tax=Thiomicrorhabdus sediminis TaxID=2580412 RepID=A0A4P9K730_9GAMM|nr:sensor domain-containing diguanylate cyclase [Thiomicrorhabdus sediminis]QCU90914.1 PAS domain S-box protein [Thiomicrorhabdus sediminis]